MALSRRLLLKGTAEVPGVGLPPTPFKIIRRSNLFPGGAWPFTILPIARLPEYKVVLTSLEYQGHFVTLKDFDGKKEFHDKHPFEGPQEQKVIIFQDHFEDIPAGQGWVLDFWGQWRPTEYCYVPQPSGDNHYLLLKGDLALF